MPLNYKSIQKSSASAAQSIEIYECTVTSALVKSISIHNGSGASADVIAKIQKFGQTQKVLYQSKAIEIDATIQLLDEVVILENGDKIWIQFSAGSIDSTTMLVESTAVLNATSVKELSDWSTTTPNDGQVPTWNSATGQYEPVDSSATISDTDDLSEGSTNLYYTNARADARIAAASIDDLSDVDTTTATPTTGQALLWDGTQWEPGTVSTVSDLDGLTDVSASSPTNGDVIVYNSAINTWVTSQSLANLVDTVKDPTPDTTVIEKDASNKITIDSTTGSEKIFATVDGTKALELTDTEARVLSVVVQDQNEVQFKQLASNGGNYVSLKAPAQLASNVDFVLPNADGASGTFLKTNGSGALSFASITEATGSELENVVEDTTPQLGGDLDVNGNKIVSASNGDIVLEPDGTGNVGIGTTTPNYLLDVESSGAGARIYNTAGSSQLHLQAYTGSNSTINFADLLSANAGAITYRHASDSLAFNVNAAERIRITSSGNVGIGTTSPSKKLHVEGGDLLVQNSSNTFLDVKGVGANAYLRAYSDSNSVWLYQGGANSYLSSQAGSTLNINSGTSNLIFSDSSGEVFRTNSGNVGIGTTSPSSKLQVQGSIRVAQNSQALDLIGTDHVYSAWYPRGTSGGRKAYMGYAGGLTTDFTAMNEDTGSFIIGTNNAERIRIDSSGNVGIGITNPYATLTVAGNITQTDNSYLISTRKIAARSASGLSLYNDGGQGIDVKDNSDVIVTSGNVGIGTASPSQKLDVDGAGRFHESLEVSHGVNTQDAAINLGFARTGSGNAYLDLIGDTTYTDYGLRVIRGNAGANANSQINHRGTGDFKLRALEAANITFDTASTERMRITSAGNVGIGTTAPAQKLEVSFAASTYGARFTRNDAAGSSLIEFANNAGVKNVTGYNAGVDGYTIGTSADTHLTVRSTGNVGIGTTSPSQKLDVVGQMNLNDGSNNVMISSGNTAMTTGTNNTSVGYQAGINNTEGFENVFFGRNSGFSTTTGSNNSFIGGYAASSNTTGSNNTAVGWAASYSNTTGFSNTAVGRNALYNCTGSLNVAIGRDAALGGAGASFSNTVGIGYQALYNLTTGANNTAVGYQAGYSLTTGEYNVSLGNAALRQNQTGGANTAVGYSALYETTGSSNTAVGHLAAYNAGQENAAFGTRTLQYTTGNNNVAIGRDAARGVSGSSTFSNTVAVGYQALTALTTGAQNTAVGFSSLRDLTTGANNTAVGYQSMLNSTTGDNNTAVGHQASYNLTTGNANISLGNYALYSSQTGEANTAIGYANSYSLTTGVYNVSLGNSALYANQTGGANVAIGYAALNTTTSGNNTAVGHLSAYYAGASNAAFGAYALNYTTGSSNVAIGFQAARGVNGTSSFSNTVAVGREALKALTTGADNTAVGYQSLYNLTTGADNTAVGVVSSYNTTTGNYNVSLGNYALRQNQTGAANTAMGYGALYYTTYSNNTAVGYFAGYFAGSHNAAFGSRALNYTTGNYNVAVGQGAAQGVSGTSTFGNTVAVGYQAGTALTTGGSNVLIGYQAGSTLTTESNKLYIENSNSSNPLIYGEFDNDLVRVNGKFEADSVTIDDEGLSAAGDYGKGAEIWYQGTSTVAAGYCYMLDSSGNWASAQANAVGTTQGMLAISAGTDSDVDGMVVRGFVQLANNIGGSVGDIVYLNESAAGRLSTTKPTGAGNFVRRVGYLVKGLNTIYFNPSNEYEAL